MAFRAYSAEFTLGNSSAEISLGLGANDILKVESATCTHTSGTSKLLTMNLASDGGAAGAGNYIEYQRTLPRNQPTNTALSGKTVTNSAKLYAFADTASVVVLQISGTIIPQTP